MTSETYLLHLHSKLVCLLITSKKNNMKILSYSRNIQVERTAVNKIFLNIFVIFDEIR